MSVVFTTSLLSPYERADYWHNLVSETFIPLDVTLHEPVPSAWSITSERLGPLQISAVQAGRQSVSRDRRLISRGGEEFLTVTQDGRRALVGPGTFTCSDAGRPYEREQPDRFRFTAIRVPKSGLGVPESDLRAVTGTVFSGDGGTSGLVAGFLRRLAERASGFDAYTGQQ
ncbi:hypothetical protein ACFCXH_37785, partial [Streptomyces nojiriensis]|uniref:cupin domain-containing protein n=1 Tax=Streptomyces nojiriensis TaxID=66374 RepID=UPI0035E4CB24